MSNSSAVEALFFAALEKVPAERAAYLDSACAGDAELRRQVEKLLKAHPRVGDFLKMPIVAQLAPAPEHSDVTKMFDTSTDGQRAVPADRTGPTLSPCEGGRSGDEDSALDFLQPSTRPDSLGRIGHYEVLEVLGRGGFGIVFRAFDETLQRVVAVKVLAAHIAATSPARKRFLREARSSAQVRHENVVGVYAVEEQPLPYLVMEFIPGETLQQRLDRTGPLETAEVVQIGRQIAFGLAAAHAQGLIHRDIKPANILIEAGPHQHVKITDFGLARAADDASMTQSGLVAGTPMFMAPEQALGEKLDHRADLFSLGTVLYTMCSGRPPFRASSTLAVLKRVAEDTPRPIREVIPEVPPWLCDIITRLHAKKPEDRIGTASEVADLLARGLAQMQRPGIVPPVVAPANRPSRLRIGGWAVAAAVLLMLTGGLSFTEATGVTHFRGTVIRLFSPEGTLVVEVDDPAVSIKVDGSDIVITGAGAKEIRLKPGKYTVEASKDGKVVSRELITVAKNGRQVVRVIQEARPADTKPGNEKRGAITPPVPTIHDTWSKALATLPLDKQGAALATKMKERLPGFEDAFLKAMAAMPADRQLLMVDVWLKERNPGYVGKVTHKVEDGVVTSLEVPSLLAQDLTPLRALTGLRTLTCRSTVGYDNKAESDAAALRSIETLEKINGKPVAQFWKEVEARQAAFKEWLQVVPALTTEQQVAAVAAKLKEHNPGFNSGMVHKTEGGVVTELGISGNVTDLSPVRALVGLKALNCSGPLSDLSPLKGMKLTSLSLKQCTHLSDLGPLKGMPLTSLALNGFGAVTDLRPLQGMPLTSLGLSGPLSDLSPLKGMKLTSLSLNHCTHLSDLGPLKGMPLTSLALDGCGAVTDLRPLQGMPLTSLRLQVTAVKDLTPLKGMPLTSLDLNSCRAVTDLGPLQGMPLTSLNLNNCNSLQDLGPLAGMKLISLSAAGRFGGTQVRDLGPLKGMPLTSLDLNGCGAVADLAPLKGMPLRSLHLPDFAKVRALDLENLRGMSSLQTIHIGLGNGLSAAEFWARYEKGEFKK